MKRVYTPLLILCGLGASLLLSTRLLQSPPHEAGRERGISGAQLQQLADRLADKIEEQQQLGDTLQRELGRTAETVNPVVAELLAGRAVEPAPPPRKVAAVRPPAAAPWWSGLHVAMVYASEGDRYAVINGKLVKENQPVGDGIVLTRVDANALYLKRGDDTYKLALRNDDA